MKIIAMKFGARIVFEALKELVEEKGNERIFYAEIANRANCSTKTVERVIRTLQTEGHVKLNGKGRRAGYSFEVRTP